MTRDELLVTLADLERRWAERVVITRVIVDEHGHELWRWSRRVYHGALERPFRTEPKEPDHE